MLDAAQLSDRAEIHDVVMRYFRGVDRADLSTIRSCFHPDAELDFGAYFCGDLDPFMEWLAGPMSLGGFERTVHFAGNVLIELDGDSARAETYCTAYHTTKPDHPWAGAFVVGWVRYVDRFARRDGVWAIARRVIAQEWIRKEPAEPFEPFPPEMAGRRDGDDALYRV